MYGRGDEIRTRDILVPNQALYQAELHPVDQGHIYTIFFILQVFFFRFLILLRKCLFGTQKKTALLKRGLSYLKAVRLCSLACFVFLLGFAEFNSGLSSCQTGYRYTERRARNIV